MTIRLLALGAGASLFLTVADSGVAQTIPQAGDSYFTAARATLREKLALTPNTKRAKNVILFVGDGMGLSTVTAGRIYQGQKRGADGESNRLAMEQLPYLALSKTYTHDAQVADSAPTATAMVTGVKTSNDMIGVNQTTKLNDCAGSIGKEVMTAFELAEKAALSTGIVSTARIVHATPAATFAHTPNRDWESDADMPAEALQAGCKDIARQLVEWSYGDGFEVALGGGRAYFMPSTADDPEGAGKKGRRKDGRDLTAEWTKRYSNSGAYVWNAEQFRTVDPENVDHLLGLFEQGHMNYEAERSQDKGGDPSLAQMSEKAVDILVKNSNGYFLMIEGGRIDHGHHDGNAYRALEDMVAFDEAVAAVMRKINLDETLVIVTADHSHVFTIAGYPKRNNPILGLVADVDGKITQAQDNKPYTTLGYANGPGALQRERPDLTQIDTKDPRFLQQATVPLRSETHSGEDVPIYAGGPFAHLFQGTVEQNVIHHVIDHATDITRRAGLR